MSSTVERKLKQEMYPELALILYRSEEEYYIEMHEIDRSGKLRSGSPLTVDCISEIASAFSAEQSITPQGAIPSNLLFYDNRKGHERYVWYNPPRKRQMFFVDNLKIEDGEYFVPGIIYEVKDNDLNLYSFKGKKPKKNLFIAPFFNITNASVCLGTSKLDYPENPSFIDFIKYWEDKFWLTEFSHLNSNPVKGNLVLATKAAKKKSFNEDILLPMNITLQELLK